MMMTMMMSGDPDQMPHSLASDLGWHCLPITRLEVSSLQWVNCYKRTCPNISGNYCRATGSFSKVTIVHQVLHLLAMITE